jgi:hypothetical protein
VTWLAAGLEGLDDEHAAPAAGARVRERLRLIANACFTQPTRSTRPASASWEIVAVVGGDTDIKRLLENVDHRLHQMAEVARRQNILPGTAIERVLDRKGLTSCARQDAAQRRPSKKAPAIGLVMQASTAAACAVRFSQQAVHVPRVCRASALSERG